MPGKKAVSAAKYSQITTTIEQELLSGVYNEKMPRMRDFAMRFAVSLRTIYKAFCPLVERGLVDKISGRRGFAVTSQAAQLAPERSKVIGVISTLHNVNVEDDPFYHSLAAAIERDGYLPLFMDGSRIHRMRNTNFWRRNWLDGYIFVYENCNFRLVEILHNNHVPLVVARMPWQGLDVPWVDFDITDRFEAFLRPLVAAGYRKIAYYQPMAEPEMISYYSNIWKQALIRYGIDDFHMFIYDDAESNGNFEPILRRAAHKLADHALRPEAVIAMSVSIYPFYDELKQCGFHFPGDLLVAYPHSKFFPQPKMPGTVAFSNADYGALAEASWTQLKLVMAHAECPPIQVPCGIVPRRRLPRNHAADSNRR